ncbi:MAG: hypothetical protein IPM56_08195 [Ignavibacteriales bacterium]|nr:MAG: hypothetical protein IPM56_08195 [Ignavibacteriales bacterium]
MKRIIFISAVLFALSINCSDTEDSKQTSEAVITAVDTRECSCCGGFFIVIDNSTYRFYSAPAGSNVDLSNPVFPINVLVEWRKSANQCLGDEIEVFKLSMR